jgi:hypothetical protein
MHRLAVLMAPFLLSGCNAAYVECGSDSVLSIVKTIATEHESNKLTMNVRTHGKPPQIKNMQDVIDTIRDEQQTEKLALKPLENDLNAAIAKCVQRYATNPATGGVDGLLQAVCDRTNNGSFREPKQPKYAYTNVPSRFGSDGTRREEAASMARFNNTVQQIVAELAPVEQAYDAQAKKIGANFKMYEQRLAMAMRNYDEKLDALWHGDLAAASYQLDTIVTRSKNKDTDALACRGNLSVKIPNWGGSHMPIDYTVEKTSDNGTYVTIVGLQ